MANDPYWNNVVLAMHMDDVGLTDLKGHAVTLVGNAARSATQSQFGGYSAYFDGSGDYLSIPHDAAFLIGAKDFTIECFVSVTSFAATRPIMSKWNTATAMTTNNCFIFSVASATSVLFAFRGTDDTTYNGVTFAVPTLSAGVLYHLSLNRSGSSWKLFVNGVQQGGTQTNANAANSAGTQVLLIGRYYSGVAVDFPGYIDDLVFTVGVARRSADFTPPDAPFPQQMVQVAGTVQDATATHVSRPVRVYRRSDGALAGAAISDATTGAFSVTALDTTPHQAVALPEEGDPYWNNVVLAMHMDGANGSTTFTDEKNHPVTATTSALTTAQQKFGTASVYYDGSSAGYVATTSSADFVLSGDFTIELWAKAATDCPTCYILSNTTALGTNGWVIEPTHATNPGKWCFFAHGIALAGNPLASTSDSLTDAWTHIAITKLGAMYCLFINGGLEDTYNNAAVMTANTSETIYVNGGTGRYKGYIDDLRITKGVARYTADFTPPSAPFPHAISSSSTENALIFDNITPV